MARQDILLDDNGKPIVRNGDLVVGDSDAQHIKHVTKLQLGEHKQHLFIGFGADNYINSTTSPQRFKRDLKVALKLDSYDATIDITNGLKDFKIKI